MDGYYYAMGPKKGKRGEMKGRERMGRRTNTLSPMCQAFYPWDQINNFVKEVVLFYNETT